MKVSNAKKQARLAVHEFKRQRGVILPFVALLVILILMLLALAVDSSLVLASRQQAIHFARLVALAGIEQYYATDCDSARGSEGCHQKSVTAAVARMNEIAKGNVLISGDGSISIKSPGEENLEVDAKIELGRWIQLEQNHECSGSPPCFVPLSNSEFVASAIRVSNSYPAGIKTVFAKALFSTESIKIKTQVTASVVPRRGCFLVDISPSITRNTHLMTSVGVAKASEFGFYLSSDNGETTTTLQDRKWQALNNNPFYVTRGAIPSSGNSDFTKTHFLSDYHKMMTMGDDSYTYLDAAVQPYHYDPSVASNIGYTAGASGSWFRVDTYRKSEYQGPEPLRSVFYGMRSAISEFKKRSVVGDKVCLIFYDHKLMWPRIVRLTGNFDYVYKFLSFDEGTEGITDDDPNIGPSITAKPTSNFERAIRHSLFPGPAAYSNTELAIAEALSQFAADSASASKGVQTSDFIVHIGDGLTNCIPHNDSGSSTDCGNDYAHYHASMTALQEFLEKYSVKTSIPVHFVLIGDLVAPHTVDIKNPYATGDEGACYSDAQLRALGPEANKYTLGGDADGHEPGSTAQWNSLFVNASAETPFYQVNSDIHHLAVLTKGIFGPIRPVEANCVKDQCRDWEKRRLTDPKCRDQATQMKDYMMEIMGQNPYTIVDVR